MKVLLRALPVILAAGHAAADSCDELARSIGGKAVWTCHAAFNSGDGATSATECFRDRDEGFRWVMARTGAARGQIYDATCGRDGKFESFRHWAKGEGHDIPFTE